ncbi:indolepyruvate oxidoreductase subunit beta family protein [Tateyamaria omphalii]|uniref:indolepyruvate oxidoreductase subunit beta family protein n=1 Tax=Tateyamaria omphalii TaxID=299262 RepID=UPI001C99FCF6|nr:indolepyruvate oxidoreductase subunit beta family protein [Tateyamaria omphalii]MBY5932713.1 indolepyruvate oxidoreductase subunit beta family protein [Tateyamaria omphalii]
MNLALDPKPVDPAVGRILKIAIIAVGGQGGGVLTNWIESLARAQGYTCQATSVAGVAQRTGATIYYVEMMPASDKTPVFSLAPAEGDVDVVIAAEMMEVGRAVMRGFVTPDRTVLIGSTHRALAVSEKTAPGDGIANSEEVRAAAEIAAQTLILADMDRLAVEQGSVISSSLFGALAGSGVLPFARDAFEDAIRRSGKGVDASLRAFNAGFEAATAGVAPAVAHETVSTERKLVGPVTLMRGWDDLATRVAALAHPVQPIASAGLKKVVDFQDVEYGTLYLDRLSEFQTQDGPERDWELTRTAAKYIANAMVYDDIIRVADLKTRSSRLLRIHEEMDASADKVLELTEFFHPRAEEVVSLFPAKMGARWEASPARMALLNRIFSKGRRLRTHTLRVFLMLHVLGGLKRYRLRTRRHAVEVQHMADWLSACRDACTEDYALAVELFKNRRLIKGYSDTHARGLTKFTKVMSAAELLKGRDDAATWVQRLREAALQDPDGDALDGAIETVKSFL